MPDNGLSPLPPDEVKTATDQVFDALYEAIISLALKPGTKLSEADVARRFGVSRQPARDAFFRLSKLGLLEVKPQSGSRVTKISVGTVKDAIFVRAALECACLRRVCRNASSDELAELGGLLTFQAGALDFKDPGRFHKLDEEFHEMLCQIAGHAHVWRVIRDQKGHVDRIRYLTLSSKRRHEVLEEHREILSALHQRDEDRAVALLDAHIARVEGTIEKLRRDHPEKFEDAEPHQPQEIT